jgi:hypothetical protein
VLVACVVVILTDNFFYLYVWIVLHCKPCPVISLFFITLVCIPANEQLEGKKELYKHVNEEVQVE